MMQRDVYGYEYCWMFLSVAAYACSLLELPKAGLKGSETSVATRCIDTPLTDGTSNTGLLRVRKVLPLGWAGKGTRGVRPRFGI